LHGFITTTQQAFYYFDKDRSGSLSLDEVYNALSHAGFRLDRPAFDNLFMTFDPDNTRTLSMAEFMGMTVSSTQIACE
jgi:Ca2+-binding EF-hand superfamily protein